MKKIFVILMSLWTATFYAQNVELFGTPKPASIMIGKADNIKSVTLDNKNIVFDEAGYFVFGFDRDAKGTHTLKVNFNKGKAFTKKIVLEKRKYQIQRLRIASKYVSPPKSQLDRIEEEAKEMKLARSEVGKINTPLYTAGFIIPAEGELSSNFGSQRILNGVKKNPHNGIDIANSEGTPVYALSDAVVIAAKNDCYYNGSFILLDHGQSLTSIYLHLSKLHVAEGDTVNKGDKIGEIGTTGRSTGPHLHLGVQWGKKRIDPLTLIELNKTMELTNP
ncbi:MAG: M23 family metallopeptidase [Melioribacteraceae bacterium]|nr:M23 family metallopeptidase [Melioribacteraceae bacterium]